jgi:hydroxymethylbilane synthase
MNFRIGTRGSALALAQANWVKRQVQNQYPDASVDLVVIKTSGAGLDALQSGATVGTGSLRRQAQIRHHRSDLSVVAIRGNVDTRLRKLDAGEVEALVMAAAGLKRLGREDRITEYIEPDICVSAVAQGALALEAREDEAQRGQLSFLHDAGTFVEVTAERSFLKRLGGGCHVPVGARAYAERDRLTMRGIVACPDGSALCGGTISGSSRDAVRLGEELAEQLLRDGADKILATSQQP